MRDSPARPELLSREASFIPYATPRSQATEEGAAPAKPIEVAELVDGLELEYAALRTKAGLFDQPHRGVVTITGEERIAFLNNMITQELKGVEPFSVGRSFWLNRKGRIDADLRLVHLPDRTLLELDAFDAAATVAALDAFIFSEDCALRDDTEATHRLGLYGPGGFAMVQGLAEHVAGPALGDLDANEANQIRIAGVEVVVARDDWLGVPCLELIVPAEGAAAVHAALLEAGQARDPGAPANSPDGAVALRPIGWHAVNLMRVEAGTPLLHLDFGPSNLPAESGVLDDRVSFTKGCYLGQEVVARMHALGKPKQTLVALRFDGATAETEQPTTGGHVYADGDAGGAVVGSVTSSSISPMLGAEPIAFAMVKTKHAAAGTALMIDAGGERLRGIVQPTLRFWPRDEAPPSKQ